MRNHKSVSLVLSSVLILGLLSLASLVSGCKTANGTKRPFIFFNTSTNSIEHKGFLLTQIAVNQVLKKHPRETVLPKLARARADLATLEAADTVSAEQINEIISRLPDDTFENPDATIYMQAGIMFFSDELETLAVQNPAQLRAAARGIGRALDGYLPKP